MMAIKTPNPTDRHVGARIRMRRLMLGMSQTALAQGLDLTFQQIQKYEKGINRVGASRLQQIAHILHVPVEFFFEDATPVVAALLKVTHSIPIVFVVVADPVGSGFVASLARPAGNVCALLECLWDWRTMSRHRPAESCRTVT